MKNICAFLLLFLLCSCASNQEIIAVDTISQKVERLDKLADLKKNQISPSTSSQEVNKRTWSRSGKFGMKGLVSCKIVKKTLK